MRSFVCGMLVGAAAVAAIWWFARIDDAPGTAPGDAEPVRPSRERDAARSPRGLPLRARGGTERTGRSVRERDEPTSDGRDSEDSTPEPFPPGTALLRIGDGYVFGEGKQVFIR